MKKPEGESVETLHAASIDLDLEELEARLEKQVLTFPMDDPEQICPYYLCMHKCSDDKCIQVCPPNE